MQIFIDIENTIIDDLSTCNLMNVQCERIKNFIKSKNPDKVNIFTWGWKDHSEIKDYIVDWIFNVLEVPAEKRGIVWTKDDSIQCLFKKKIINVTDELELEDLHIPGAMKRFGMEKPTSFIHQIMDLAGFPNGKGTFILIDDLNPMWEEKRIFNNDLEIIFENPANLEGENK